ncbi:hypothetical protein J3458_013161 [Metarhizium acridum]|uniref:uncharacterized protein n=1 Tax=Metarhizium acridum TaxID=92637 RepID=UPI001C6CA316|nr:hypothetical protein J3458_013161 [Metarhizium acridum]
MAIPLTNFHFGPRRVLVPSWLFRSGLHLVFLIKYGSTVVGVEGIDIDSGRSFSRLHNMHAHRLRSGPSDVAIVEDVLPVALPEQCLQHRIDGEICASFANSVATGTRQNPS